MYLFSTKKEAKLKSWKTLKQISPEGHTVLNVVETGLVY